MCSSTRSTSCVAHSTSFRGAGSACTVVQTSTRSSPRRTIFEYWSHAASIVPMTEYRYYRPRMIATGERIRRDYADWLEQNPGVLERTLDSIRELGPRTSAEFERDPGEKRTGPWDWYGPKASRRWLEMLWTSGDLMIHSRRAGQKTYDVRERVLAEGQEAPPNDDDLPTPEEVTHRLVGRTLQALGVVTLSWTADYFRLPAPTSGALPCRRRRAGVQGYGGEWRGGCRRSSRESPSPRTWTLAGWRTSSGCARASHPSGPRWSRHSTA
ncbi:MAG: crosslink repair DNA glycosylase YcaQ family protein [Chloroflexia bacterium]